jgi:uncharacterized protein
MGEYSPSLAPAPAVAVPPARPVAESERITPLDVLRGVGVLGILALNIKSFSMVGAAYVNPQLGGLAGANYWVWYLTTVLGENRFATIFSMLFGAGVVLMTGRQKASRWRVALLHYRRMLALMLIGAAHALLLWNGDILFLYGLCGLVLFLVRRFPAWLLMLLGVLVLAGSAGYSYYRFLELSSGGGGELGEFVRRSRPDSAMIDEETQAYLNGWFGEVAYRAPKVWQGWTNWRMLFGVGLVGGWMLIGMGLFKVGAFSAALSRRAYWVMSAGGLGAGLPALMYMAHLQTQESANPITTRLEADLYARWASLLVTLAYVGIVMLVCQSPRLAPLTAPLAATGRMALTNYLMQSVICTTIFYGRGFGLFGQVDRVGQMIVVLGVWALQLALSPLWLSFFRFGPVEWLWRTMTYLKLQPMRRRPQPAMAVGVALGNTPSGTVLESQ